MTEEEDEVQFGEVIYPATQCRHYRINIPDTGLVIIFRGAQRYSITQGLLFCNIAPGMQRANDETEVNMYILDICVENTCDLQGLADVKRHCTGSRHIKKRKILNTNTKMQPFAIHEDT